MNQMRGLLAEYRIMVAQGAVHRSMTRGPSLLGHTIAGALRANTSAPTYALLLQLGSTLAGGVATQKCNADYQNQNEQPEQGKLNHGSAKDALALGRQCSSFGEGGGFQANHEDPSNRGNQAHDEEWFYDHQNMRVDGDSHRMQDLHQRQDEQ